MKIMKKKEQEMTDMKISIISPTVRPEGLEMVARCLRRQDFDDWEWIITTPERMIASCLNAIPDSLCGKTRILAEPPKREDDYYRLSGAFNKGFQEARGELVITIVDLIWFPPDTLSRLWTHFENNPKAFVTTIGHQYTEEINGKPENLVWTDPRARQDQGTFYEVSPADMEMCLASMPRKALLEVGGIDEDYDKGAAVGEKEMCWRLDKLGYKFFIDQSIEYRAIQHPRLSKEWDEKYKIASALFIDHMRQLQEGTRILNVGYIK